MVSGGGGQVANSGSLLPVDYNNNHSVSFGFNDQSNGNNFQYHQYSNNTGGCGGLNGQISGQYC